MKNLDSKFLAKDPGTGTDRKRVTGKKKELVWEVGEITLHRDCTGMCLPDNNAYLKVQQLLLSQPH